MYTKYNIFPYILISITETSVYTYKKTFITKPLPQVVHSMPKISVTIKYGDLKFSVKIDLPDFKIINMENPLLQVYSTTPKISVSIKSWDFVFIIPNLRG